MPNPYFQFKQFTIHQQRSAMKVTTDACLFGAWVAKEVKIDPDSHQEKDKNVLDIGTGTGLLSLMYVQKNPDVIIDAIEIDKDAYEQAKENVAGSPWNNRIHVLPGNVKAFSFEKKYDLIISNPPFYENELRSGDSKKNIAHHHEGLLLRELLQIIQTNLSSTGIFCLLIPYKRNKELKILLKDFSVLQMTFVRQSPEHDYFRIMLMGELKRETETMIDEISIRDSTQQYTREFTELLKDYYLGLTSQPPLQ